MKVIEVAYGRTVNLGNYQSSRIDMRASVDENEDPKQAFAKLKVLVLEEAVEDVKESKSK